jgi:hypothetical protein
MRLAYSEEVGNGPHASDPTELPEWQADAIRRCQDGHAVVVPDQASLSRPSWRVPRSGMPTIALCRPGQGDLIFSYVTEQLEFDQDSHIVTGELFADFRRG